MYIYSNTDSNLLYVITKEPLKQYQITDMQGESVICPIMSNTPCDMGYRAVLNASSLALWTLEDPVLYTFQTDSEQTTFGHSSLRTVQNKMVLFNDAPIYLRGYIRGIAAHDHPNMTGKSDYEAALKNIRQAKKYGFNLVRFHSTIPSEDFVRAADELGLLIHMEIGFAYEYDDQGNKKNLSMSNQEWENTILKYRKPRYMTELPKLIHQKGLGGRMIAYQKGSREWKLMAMKVYLEKMRLSPLCGYEMLQFSDCLKYENKNGIVDCFDDDKGIDSKWLKQMNDDFVLLADFDSVIKFEDEQITAAMYASDFLPQPEVRGDYRLWLDDELIYEGYDFVLCGGLQKLCEIKISPKRTGKAKRHFLKAEFTGDQIHIENSWKLWFYPRKRPARLPNLHLSEGPLKSYLEQGTEHSPVEVTDSLDDHTLAMLADGKTVILFYEYGAGRNKWQLPGALERFKPCIWDRGSNLGGMILSSGVQAALGSGRYFDLNLQPLLEAGSKVNLDSFPAEVTEFVSGIDKPVRDRMKGMIHGIKHFIDEDTLRKFSHLFSVKVGQGTLIVCTLNVSDPQDPVTANLLCMLIDHPEAFYTDFQMDPTLLKNYLEEVASKGLRPEDVMNHFWEIDNKLVEDTLFWEEAGVNLADIKE